MSKAINEIKQPVAEHMLAFEEKFKDAMKSSVPLLDKITNYIVKRKGKQHFPWRMPLYPLPVILAILIWGYIFFSTGEKMMLGGVSVIIFGLIAYLIKSKRNKEWPWKA